MDIGAIAAEHVPLQPALDAAAEEPKDETGWLIATRGTVYALIGLRLRPGEDDGGIFAAVAPPCDWRAATAPPGNGSDRNETDRNKGATPSSGPAVRTVQAVELVPPASDDVDSILDEIARSIEPWVPCPGGGGGGGSGDGGCGSRNCEDYNPCTNEWCDLNPSGGYQCSYQPIDPGGVCCIYGHCCTGPYQHCNNDCCEEDELCCFPECCPIGKCCGPPTCCEEDEYCCDRDRHLCCPEGQDCCGDKCYDPLEQYCCNATLSRLCQKSPDDPSLDEVCCGDHCCPPENTCCGPGCCTETEDCCKPETALCCSSGSSAPGSAASAQAAEECCPASNECCGEGFTCCGGQRCWPVANCCAGGILCLQPCEGCLNNGSLSPGTIEVTPDPPCPDDTIRFTVSGVTDSGGKKRVNCTEEQQLGPVAPTFEWQLTLPPNYPPPLPPLSGNGASVSVHAKAPGTYSVRFKANAERECPPPEITIGPESVVVPDVDAVTWEPFPGNDALGGDPNNGGERIFPGKRSSGDGAAADRRKVQLKARIGPAVEGCTVYFRTWDVDDPFDQNNSQRPNVQVIDNDATGPDNRRTDPGVTSGTETTDAAGEARFTVTMSMQPGNNYRGAASGFSDAISAVTQADADANTAPARVKFTDMLTVWRRLHVELDSMAAVTGNQIDTAFTDIVGAGTALTEVTGTTSLDDGSQDLDDTPPENGRFENGTLIIGTAPTTIVISPLTGNGDNRVVFPQASIAGLPFLAKDNDWWTSPETMSGTITEVVKSGAYFVWTLNVTASSETPINWAEFVVGKLSVGGGAEVDIEAVDGALKLVLTDALSIPSILRDDDNNNLLPKFPSVATMGSAYEEAYVVPVLDVGDNNLNVPFALNTEDTDIDWDSRSLNAADFWVAYVLKAHQWITFEASTGDGDNDPDSETSVFGITDFSGGSLIYLEVHQTHEGITNPLAEEQDTVVHETGHAVGRIPASGEPVTVPGQLSTFMSESLNSIRSSPQPWS